MPGTPQPGRRVRGKDRFHFGSYGRVQPSINDQGGRGERPRVVNPAPRIDEGSYVELEFGYLAFTDPSGLEVDTVTTIAFTEEFFHFNGDFDSTVAVRNLFAEARNLYFKGIYVWVGSRMYRGDDVYLLDFWPLDNLNTYGGGTGWSVDKTRIGWHAGVNRLDDEYQLQTLEVPLDDGIGAQEVVFLDRQRFITSLKAEQLFYDGDSPGFKAKLYGELHHLPQGTLRREQPRRDELLPDDQGWMIGAQFGTWNFIPGATGSFLNLFVRYASGLAAYGEFAIPFGVDQDKRAEDAEAVQLALSGNVDTRYVGVMFGAMARYFVDADRVVEDFDDGWEMAYVVRPMAFIGKYFTPGLEVSYQGRRPNGINPKTGTQDLASIWKISVLPALTFGSSTYARPQLRFNYTLSIQDEAARQLYNSEDPLASRELVHFVGLAAEWWFNSSSYVAGE